MKLLLKLKVFLPWLTLSSSATLHPSNEILIFTLFETYFLEKRVPWWQTQSPINIYYSFFRLSNDIEKLID